jgi:hypothetical protein
VPERVIMDADDEFFRVARDVRNTIYEGDLSDKLTKTNDFLWHTAVQRLLTKFDVSDSFKITAGRIIKSRGSLASIAKDLTRWIDDGYMRAMLDDIINQRITTPYVELDENWKDKVNSYVFHIREVVTKADVAEGLRERIFAALNQLQAEVDRNRTLVESVAEVFLTLTEAANKGAKNLSGAVRLVERLAGAISGLRTAQVEQQKQLKLPPPEQTGLRDLDAPDEPAES